MPSRSSKIPNAKIILAHDGSAFADAALEDLARAGLPPAGQARVLTFASVHPLPVAYLPGELDTWYAESLQMMADQSRAERKEAAAVAEKAAARLRKIFPGWKVSARAAVAQPADGILDAAATWKASLIVVGSHGRTALKRLLLGSVSHSVLAHAPCTVRIDRGARETNGKSRTGTARMPAHILIAVDGSREAEAALTTVAKRAWKTNTVFRVVMVADYPPVTMAIPGVMPEVVPGTMPGIDFRKEWKEGARRVAEKAVAILARQGRKADYALREGDPREEIVAEARRFKADTLFIGSHAHGALRRFLLGSTSLSVAEHAPCTVEVVR